MPRKKLKTLVIVLCGVVLLLGAIAFAYDYFLLRGPLSGDTRYEFPLVELAQSSTVELHHTFHLTNKNSQPIEVRQIKPDCGCVTVGAGPQTIHPGEALDLPITMAFRGGDKRVMIHLDLGDAGSQTLHVRARGRFQTSLLPLAGELIVSLDYPVTFSILASMFETPDKPPPPSIAAPPGVEASFQGWISSYQSNDSTRIPNQWLAEIIVRRTGPEMPADAAITIELKPAAPVTIPIRAGQTTIEPDSVSPEGEPGSVNPKASRAL